MKKAMNEQAKSRQIYSDRTGKSANQIVATGIIN